MTTVNRKERKGPRKIYRNSTVVIFDKIPSDHTVSSRIHHYRDSRNCLLFVARKRKKEKDVKNRDRRDKGRAISTVSFFFFLFFRVPEGTTAVKRRPRDKRSIVPEHADKHRLPKRIRRFLFFFFFLSANLARFSPLYYRGNLDVALPINASEPRCRRGALSSAARSVRSVQPGSLSIVAQNFHANVRESANDTAGSETALGASFHPPTPRRNIQFVCNEYKLTI